jgi:hypothetical protein
MRIVNRAAWPILAGVLAVTLATGCAHQPAPPPVVSYPGFFSGLWHGLVAPLAFVASIVSDVRMYAYPNTGVLYDLGFLLGLGAWGGGAAARRR